MRVRVDRQTPTEYERADLVASAWLTVTSFTIRSMVSMEARRIFEVI